MNKKNPIIQSVVQIAKAELTQNLKLYYDKTKKDMGPDFEAVMAEIVEEILACQSKCKEGTSFLAAGLLLCLPPTEGDEEFTKEEHKMLNETIHAAIYWHLTKDDTNELDT